MTGHQDLRLAWRLEEPADDAPGCTDVVRAVTISQPSADHRGQLLDSALREVDPSLFRFQKLPDSAVLGVRQHDAGAGGCLDDVGEPVRMPHPPEPGSGSCPAGVTMATVVTTRMSRSGWSAPGRSVPRTPASGSRGTAGAGSLRRIPAPVIRDRSTRQGISEWRSTGRTPRRCAPQPVPRSCRSPSSGGPSPRPGPRAPPPCPYA